MQIYEHVAFASSIFEIDLPGISDRIDTSTYKLGQTSGLQYNSDFDFLVETFESVCKTIGEDLFHLKDGYTYDIASMWLNKSNKDAWLPPHNHCNTFLSGVLMLDEDGDDFPNLEFLRPQPLQIMPSIKNYNHLNSNMFGVHTIKDKLYVFPSYMMHFVRVNLNEKIRQSIAFDIIVRGVYYEDTDGQGSNIGKFEI